jgi:hypothetical protein
MNRSEIDGTLAEAIDAAISRVDSRALARAAEALTVRYRTVAVPEPRDAKPGAAGLLPRLTEAERAAYLAVRAPAT